MADNPVKIVVLDGSTVNPGDNPWDAVCAHGELTVYERTPPELIVERAADAGVILTNKTPLSAAVLEQLPSLGFISELATGFDNVDVASAGRRGIPVSNVPEYSTDSVAQHVFAMLLELCNRVAEHDTAVKRGEWSASPDFSFCKGPLLELSGMKLGIIGLGRIGLKVAEIGHVFGLKILAFNPHNRNINTGVPVSWRDLHEIFSEADVISLHCPLTPDNRGFVNRDVLSSMKPGAFLINTARGALVNEAELAWALDSGTIAGAAVDVVSREPIASDNPLLRAKNCLITPHIAWASIAARRRLMATTADNVAAFLRGTPINVVNQACLEEKRANQVR